MMEEKVKTLAHDMIGYGSGMMTTTAPDKPIFDAFRLLIGPYDNNDVRLIKSGITVLDKTDEDHELFRILGLLDDNDTISPYEFETLKQGIVSYQANNSG